MLFEVEPTDPLTFAIIAISVAIVSSAGELHAHAPRHERGPLIALRRS
jgi:hypothetical protein